MTMEFKTKQAMIDVRTEMSGSESFILAALNEIRAVEDAESFTKADAAFLRSRIEGAIERAIAALALIPEGEE